MCRKRMAFIFSLLAASSALGLWSCSAQVRQEEEEEELGLDCLPAEVKPDDVVSAVLMSTRPAGEVVKKVTVQEKLSELNAGCRDGKLVDGAGREIYFYRLIGCWGMPPPDYEEILQRQVEELEALRKQYTVIEMTCDPSGMPRQ